MKKMNKKLFHAFMTLLLIVSVFIPLLKTSYTVKAEELPSNSYTMTTSPTINNNRLVDGAKYGEGKFYLNPTYKFDNSATLKNGDFMVYKVPKEFKVERDITTDIYAKDGATKIAELQTNAATNSATVTITNEEYFKNLTEDRELTALFTVVWADDVELNKEYSIDIPGAGTYRLTRIVPDDDPTGYTKWGVQDADDPNYVNWRIRINRYVKPVTGVKIEDTIPEGQVLASEITGYYFTEWNKAEARPRLDASHVNVTGTNSFTITPNGNGDLSTQGLYVLYRTRLTAPVDNTTKKAFNNVKVTTSDGVYDVDGFAPLTTTEGIGSGARPSEVEFEVTKQLNGGTLKGDEFIFQLIDPDGKVVETAKNNKDGQVKFKAIKFSKAGTFKYQIKEVDEKEPGYVYDNKTINAEVTVTDVYGEKIASVKYDNKVFVNSYSAKPTTATIEAIKVLKGRALEADKYEFELKEGDTVVGTAKNKADGSVVFPAIEYTAAGPHTYTITEKAGNEPGVTYDTASHTVTVDVADNGRGQLEATVPADKPVFTNTYAAKPGKTVIEAKKVLNGKELEADKYEFELKENDKVVGTAKNTADGSISFPEIEYTKAGTYTYTMSEKAGNEPGVTYDKTSHKVTVEVVDNGQGQLEATVTSEKPVFVNDYVAKPGKKAIEAKKVLNGKALEADKYEFELKDSEGNLVDTAKNKADGSITFKEIEYKGPGLHTYLVSEKAGKEENVTYDTNTHEVTVEVADNGQGQLVATITSEQPVFTNTYTKPAPAADTITIEATKTLVGKELEAGKYEFELKEGDKVIGTATNAADGKVVFPSITYTEAGTHTYTVAEKAGNEENVTYDTTVHTVTVEVADNGQGKLVSTITGNKPAFVNKYTAPTPPPTPNPQQPTPATATIQANKVLTGKELKDGQFEFELTYQGNVVDTAKNKADGSVTFKSQSFTSPGKYEYTITEKAGNEAGVTYDKTVHKVTVEVAYDTNGKLVATVTGNGPTFTNTYAAKTPPTSSEEKPKPSGDKHEDPKKEEPKKEVKKELPKTGTAESSAFSVLVGFLLLAASVFLYRTKKVD
ncbi:MULTISPECIES: SGO_0107 family LPXTG-anchored pilin-like protein [Streptococcus]|uniref:LPXTG cell wall anchor domain-containing protein n=1 Tax=Streptococcus gordonii TaxID=1302 RepID=A0AB35FRI7_STRGN|nr:MULTISPECIES: SGO_0107 family LPXTG-anchored pilin-like protein [Streptococcus]MBS6245128.1 LPXTG cell wall anchor domain-containing protein [Streptococcus sp.]MBZ2126552.1 LPXTG cell wall anchor domain-containing protein [Streptococcus gordonii]MBZ2128566.1 LPXTG cell wall anchor domain-containing protein [Streptococcus gordonii]OFU69505.1 cell surface protein [Streptococcus sp. HMSC10A01]RSJ47457.1 T surface-antigen of pili [Streptococcus gordonii]